MSGTSKSSSTSTYLYSVVGVLAMAALLIALNVIARSFTVRLDLTEDRIHTLSPGTEAILAALDTQVTVRLYYSRDSARRLTAFDKSYPGRVEDLLREYRRRAGSHLSVQVLDPAPDSAAEESANLDGIQPEVSPDGENVYFGLAVSCLGKTETVPVLTPTRENFLEYDLTRAIYRVTHPDKGVVGLLTALPVMGRQNPMMMMMGPQRGDPPWEAISILKRDYEIRELPPDVSEIPADIPVLLLIHPKKLPDRTLFALDQFLLRGGRLVAFLDPKSEVEAYLNPMGPMNYAPPEPSSLGPLLEAWGVQFTADRVVADLLTMTSVAGEGGRGERRPTWLSLTRDESNAEDPATTQLETLLLVSAGAFTGGGTTGLRRTVLLQSTEESQLVDSAMAASGEEILGRFAADGERKALAIRLDGRFPTAFPAGAPGEEKAADSTAETGTAPVAPAVKTTALAQAQADGAVVLVGDVDLLYDALCVAKGRDERGRTVSIPMNDNLALLQNLLDSLSGDADLVAIRSRGVIRRPFTVVARMQAEASRRYETEIARLQEALWTARARVEELQRQKGKDQKLILSPEQAAEVKKYQEQVVETSRELKRVRKELRAGLDRLEATIRWLNLALVPALVGLAGLLVGLRRSGVSRRTKVGAVEVLSFAGGELLVLALYAGGMLVGTGPFWDLLRDAGPAGAVGALATGAAVGLLLLLVPARGKDED